MTTIENTTLDQTPTLGQTTEEIQVKNPEALLKKNRELLRELADTKAALQVAQDSLGAAHSENKTLGDNLYRIRTTDPLEGIVATLSPSPKLMLKTLNDLFDVRLDADHKPILFNKEGQPLTWTKKGQHGYGEEVAVMLERESLVQWLLNGFEGNPDGPQALMFKAQGTGALGSSGASYKPAAPATPAAPPPAPLTPLGLR